MADANQLSESPGLGTKSFHHWLKLPPVLQAAEGAAQVGTYNLLQLGKQNEIHLHIDGDFDAGHVFIPLLVVCSIDWKGKIIAVRAGSQWRPSYEL